MMARDPTENLQESQGYEKKPHRIHQALSQEDFTSK